MPFVSTFRSKIIQACTSATHSESGIIMQLSCDKHVLKIVHGVVCFFF